MNINRLLKYIKSNVSANYVCSNNKEFIIITNKVAVISQYITTIRGTNMNSGVYYCKNCWKWGYTTYSSKYQKCNSSHELKHHREMVWYYKANFKINSPKFETKKEESCIHSFKYINCKSKYQIDSNICPFWKHRFNRDWHTKKS